MQRSIGQLLLPFSFAVMLGQNFTSPPPSRSVTGIVEMGPTTGITDGRRGVGLTPGVRDSACCQHGCFRCALQGTACGLTNGAQGRNCVVFPCAV